MASIHEIMDGVVFIDREGHVALLNPVAEELLGVKGFQALGHKLEAADPEGAELTRAILDDHDRIEGAGEIQRTVEIQVGEHELTYVDICTTQVLDCDREPAGVITSLRDITSEYKSDQLRNQYLSIVAHELRTPLTGIKTFSTLMAKGRLGDLNEKQTQAIESIREQSLRLEHQIDKLINLGNLDANEYAEDPEVLDISELLAAAAAPFESTAAESGGVIVIEAETVVDRSIRADRTDIKRVLKSLIENAVKFTSGTGRVVLRAELVDDRVRFEIADNGPGVEPRYHRRIFEKFFQVEDPLTRYHGGAGLGLFVAQGIIQAHGSRIEVSSDVGHGASFSFDLPLFEVSIGNDSPETAAVLR